MRHKKRIMVCVTQQKSCARLIDKGAALCRTNGHDELHVVHVIKDGWKYFGQLKESDAIEFLYEQAKNHGAQLSISKAKDIEETLRKYVEEHQINTIVMGQSLEPTIQQNMVSRLQKHLKTPVEVVIVPTEVELVDVMETGAVALDIVNM